jgi:hypothetical protein
MSLSNERSDYSLVFADRDQNYYVIPVEAIERGRVPAEGRAEVEQVLGEHDVTGYHPAAFAAGVVAGAALVGSATVLGAAAGALGAVVIGAALSSDCFPVKPAPGGNMQ